jgi:hypothetical protein
LAGDTDRNSSDVKQGSESRAFAITSIVLALVVLISAGYEILRWSLDKNAWAEQQCQDVATRFEVCVGNVTSRSPFQIVRAHLIILGVVLVAAMIRHLVAGQSTEKRDSG